jgi:hypothetical protein
MKTFNWRFLVGLLLVLAGGFFMANQWFGWSPANADLLFGAFFGLAGIAFLYVLFTSPSSWWAVIPGLTLVGLSALILGGTFASSFMNVWGGPIFLGSIGLAFLVIFLLDHKRWWAIIPAGALFSVAGTALMASFDPAGLASGGVLFVGLGLTFLSLLLLKRNETRKWPWFPGGILLAMGVVMVLGSSDWLEWIWPVALLLGGGVVIFLALRRKQETHE